MSRFQVNGTDKPEFFIQSIQYCSDYSQFCKNDYFQPFLLGGLRVNYPVKLENDFSYIFSGNVLVT